MKNLVFLLEEPSASVMLEGVLPRLLPEIITWHCIVFEGKQDLEKTWSAVFAGTEYLTVRLLF